MKLFIGGRNQGKTAYAEAKTGLHPVYCTPDEALSVPAINCFHLLVRFILETGGDLSGFLKALVRQNPEAVVVSDEIGLGVVPVDLFERRWREETGRALCLLAERAETVERVSCGLGQVLK